MLSAGRRAKPLLWLWLASLAVFLGMVATAQGALAHSAVLSTMPADGALLDARPDLITVAFNEPVTVIAIRLFDSSGNELALKPRVTSGANIIASAPETVPPGDYLEAIA